MNISNLARLARRCAGRIRDADHVILTSHVDADGLTSAGIMHKALARLNIGLETVFLKQLDTPALESLADKKGLIVFTDLGSGLAGKIEELGLESVIIDHHVPQENSHPYHLNPHRAGVNGASELSGSAAAYLVARALGDNHDNRDLAGLAVVGAVGDLQHLKTGRLDGVNRQVLDEGVEAGVLSCGPDLRLFGRQTRPLSKLLEYSSDPYIPGLTGREDRCIRFLESLGIPLKDAGEWRRWIDLSDGERQRFVSGLVQQCLEAGVPSYKAQRLVGEVYTLEREPLGSELRDASEYSTLLNATARYDHAGVGLAVCLGDRGEGLGEARRLLREHRRNLVHGLTLVQDQGITQLDSLQYFDAGGEIRETIVGIIAGMSYSLSNRRDLPIIAFADAEDGVKVSARGTQDLVRRGLDLSNAMNTCAEKVGGAGGGHDIAAGATIPPDKKQEFLQILDEKISTQLK